MDVASDTNELIQEVYNDDMLKKTKKSRMNKELHEKNSEFDDFEVTNKRVVL